MYVHTLVRTVRGALVPLFIALAVSALAGVNTPSVAGVPWTTDLDGSGSTTLNDFAIFGCAYLGAATCPCPYQFCGTHVYCDPSCPQVSLPCNCGSGVAAWHSDFDCTGTVGLSDLVIIANAFLSGTTHSGVCQ